jgi:hypothetical protein
MMYMVWRFNHERPEFLIVCTSEESSREVVKSYGQSGWQVTAVPVRPDSRSDVSILLPPRLN